MLVYSVHLLSLIIRQLSASCTPIVFNQRKVDDKFGDKNGRNQRIIRDKKVIVLRLFGKYLTSNWRRSDHWANWGMFGNCW